MAENSVPITAGSGTGIAAMQDGQGNYVQVTADQALISGILDLLLAEQKRTNLILCAMAGLDYGGYANVDLTER